MKSLGELCEGIIESPLPEEFQSKKIQRLTADSRQVEPGSLFIAWEGKQTDGHKYISEAIARGAEVILCEKPLEVPPEILLIPVENSRRTYALLCSRWFDHPEKSLHTVGITGTNGKSSTAYYLYQLWRGLQRKTGLIGTVFCLAEETVLPATLTTPDSYELYRLLRHFVDSGITHVAMEVSSIALDQYRTEGIPFQGAVFTNLSHDHLDYHGTFTAYRDAKKRLFDRLASESFALTNIDDKNGLFMLQNTAAYRYGYSLQQVSDFQLSLREAGLWGMEYELRVHLGENQPRRKAELPFEVHIGNLHAPLIGRFQGYNLLAAVAATFLSEYRSKDHEERRGLWQHLALLSTQLKTLPGRLEPISLGHERMGLVDYAHTPDAVEKVLRSLRSLVPAGGKLIAVLGAGGNRDRSKRGPMGIAAAQWADMAILTSDNPRNEDPLSILEEMCAPIPADLRRRVLRIPDRREAIRTAIQMAPPHSLIIVLGKGHETYQEIQGVKYPFSDREELLRYKEEPYAE
ncbi:MAG: UDP-N-acetylmuramoyl-L-alanyl-D-glutamate--2,6-diaminopimelate ligase [Bacteroidia bacterium]|nr:UDP-N-acetylmuramoyl-L-alanyl-D-glutamate--2,6-diaminopimelate ligase [Bacteroidia bacterium]